MRVVSMSVTNNFTAFLILLVAVIVGSCAVLPISANPIAISAPEIYPDHEGPFIGMVQVTFSSNAPDSEIHYKINAAADADPPNKLDPKYTGDPVQITTVGKTTISAVAVSTVPGRGDSHVVSRRYIVEKASIEPPVASPPPGTYVGAVLVRLRSSSSQTTADNSNNKCDIVYSIDDPNPGEQWVSASQGSVIELDTIGRHSIYAKCVVGGGGSGKSSSSSSSSSQHQNSGATTMSSAVTRLMYEIKPAMMYDIASECSKCGFQPTVGEVFTIALQGVSERSTFFLTTSVQGCERENHFLDDTNQVTIEDERRTFPFWTSEDAGRVWVCLKAPGENAFVVVPHRHATHTHFFLEKHSGRSLSARDRPLNYATAPPHHQSVQLETPGSGINGVAIVLGLVLVLGLAWVAKVLRVMTSRSDVAPRRGAAGSSRQQQQQQEGESMVEKN